MNSYKQTGVLLRRYIKDCISDKISFYPNVSTHCQLLVNLEQVNALRSRYR